MLTIRLHCHKLLLQLCFPIYTPRAQLSRVAVLLIDRSVCEASQSLVTATIVPGEAIFMLTDTFDELNKTYLDKRTQICQICLGYMCFVCGGHSRGTTLQVVCSYNLRREYAPKKFMLMSLTFLPLTVGERLRLPASRIYFQVMLRYHDWLIIFCTA